MKDMPHLTYLFIGGNPMIGVEGRSGEEASMGGNGGGWVGMAQRSVPFPQARTVVVDCAAPKLRCLKLIVAALLLRGSGSGRSAERQSESKSAHSP
jgi:hypothetical protein